VRTALAATGSEMEEEAAAWSLGARSMDRLQPGTGDLYGEGEQAWMEAAEMYAAGYEGGGGAAGDAGLGARWGW